MARGRVGGCRRGGGRRVEDLVAHDDVPGGLQASSERGERHDHLGLVDVVNIGDRRRVHGRVRFGVRQRDAGARKRSFDGVGSGRRRRGRRPRRHPAAPRTRQGQARTFAINTCIAVSISVAGIAVGARWRDVTRSAPLTNPHRPRDYASCFGCNCRITVSVVVAVIARVAPVKGRFAEGVV